MDGNSYNGDLNQIKSIKTFKRHFHQNQFLFIYYLNVNMMNTRKVDSNQGEETIIKTEFRNFVTFYETF